MYPTSMPHRDWLAHERPRPPGICPNARPSSTSLTPPHTAHNISYPWWPRIFIRNENGFLHRNTFFQACPVLSTKDNPLFIHLPDKCLSWIYKENVFLCRPLIHLRKVAGKDDNPSPYGLWRLHSQRGCMDLFTTRKPCGRKAVREG